MIDEDKYFLQKISQYFMGVTPPQNCATGCVLMPPHQGVRERPSSLTSVLTDCHWNGHHSFLLDPWLATIPVSCFEARESFLRLPVALLSLTYYASSQFSTETLPKSQEQFSPTLRTHKSHRNPPATPTGPISFLGYFPIQWFRKGMNSHLEEALRIRYIEKERSERWMTETPGNRQPEVCIPSLRYWLCDLPLSFRVSPSTWETINEIMYILLCNTVYQFKNF